MAERWWRALIYGSLGSRDERGRHQDPLKAARQIDTKWLCDGHVLHVYGIIPSELNSRPPRNPKFPLKLGWEWDSMAWKSRAEMSRKR
jgi:hypothetical protein